MNTSTEIKKDTRKKTFRNRSYPTYHRIYHKQQKKYTKKYTRWIMRAYRYRSKTRYKKTSD